MDDDIIRIKWVDDAVEGVGNLVEVVPTSTRTYIKSLDSYVDSSAFVNKIDELGLTDDIGTLIQKDYVDLTKPQYDALVELRNTIPNPTSDTLMQKVIKPSDFEAYYLNKANPSIGGCVAKASDVKHLDSYSEIRNGLRLDYDTTSFPVDGNEMYAIKFKTNDINNLDIPDADYLTDNFGKVSSPQTGTGFTSAKDGSLIPEYNALNRMKPQDGAEIYKIVDGEETLVAVYDSALDMFVGAKSK